MLEYKPVLFKLGKETYGIDIARVQGIENQQEVVRVPNTASYIKGIMHLRGEVIPVYNLRNKFGMPDEEGEKQFIIIETEGVHVALEVDKVEEIYNATDIHDAPVIVKSGATAYIEKVVNLGDRIVVTIDINNLLTAEEKAGVKSMVEAV